MHANPKNASDVMGVPFGTSEPYTQVIYNTKCFRHFIQLYLYIHQAWNGMSDVGTSNVQTSLILCHSSL